MKLEMINAKRVVETPMITLLSSAREKLTLAAGSRASAKFCSVGFDGKSEM